MIREIPYNENWMFTKNNEPAYAHERMKEGQFVSLPHTWNAEDGCSSDYYRGSCWYQNLLTVSPEDLTKQIYLEIGAAGNVGKIYVNGCLAEESRCGYAMFRANLTPYLKAGGNLISIMVDNTYDNEVLPLLADFTFYGGLYREVKLLMMEDLHFDVMDNGRDGVYFTQKKIGDRVFEWAVQGQVINELSPTTGNVRLLLRDHDGNVVSDSTSELEFEGVTPFELRGEIVDPILWHGVERPYLYTATITISAAGRIRDSRQIEIGFRTIEITTEQGLLLNGSPLKLNGVCRHQDFAGVGNAVTKSHMEQDIALIREVGANSIRLAHYQHDDYFYSLCDRHGLLVWAEIPFISVPSSKDPENQNAVEQLEKLVKQAFNHTSIYCWGVQNEITIAVETEYTHKTINKLVDLVNEWDPGRYTAQANINGVEDNSIINSYTDVVGYNLYYGWYYGDVQDLQKRFDSFHAANPDIPLILSEYGVDTNPKFHSYVPKVKDYTEEYQLMFHHNAIKAIHERPFVIGGYVWNMFDFGSANRKEGGETGRNLKGLVTFDRLTKKDAFYLYKAYWSKEPFVHLAGRRFVNRHQAQNDIMVLTNLQDVRVYVNNAFIARIQSDEAVKIVKNVLLSEGDNLVRVEGVDGRGSVCMDEMVLHRVYEPDESYIHVVEDQSKNVVNWFEKFDLSETEAVPLKDGYYSTFDTIEDLYSNEAAKAVFLKYFGHVTGNPFFEVTMNVMSIEKMAQLEFYKIVPELLIAMNKELNVIQKVEAETSDVQQ
ncbi:beta-galactosidase [Paenibacillus mucilaginosus 3016]|uniref:Beta-galactosidase n=1 Tax=Paenibacillus mucilaginosus 3016 TaxID=1116391 RepID=H6NA73_9BACL|nr:glycoside hydrolase family 2 TIM barrel-domain containing protein [Paenibacillus mucilaginosus]AFC28917.1 beta-galactosidase [Paenibacillus mucilaginosus 3016]WFA17671.1 beta-galactosidase [Paenibacillus mucilaginosus]